MKLIRRVFSVLIFVSILYPWVIFAVDSGFSLFQEGNKSYAEGRYEEAIAYYERAINDGVRNSDLYYNLGNSYYRAGDLGRAVLFWWRAERLNPGDVDIRANLEFANKLISERIFIQEQGALNYFIQGFRDIAGLRGWGFILSICIWGFWISLALFLVISGRRVRRVFFYGMIVFVFLMILSGAGFGMRYRWEKEPAGVVIEKRVSVRSGPGDNYSLLFELPAGVRVLIQECGNGWCKIKFPPGMIGWLEGKGVERI